jgi:hypothetical protein
MATVLHTHGNGRTASRLPDRTTADHGHPTLSPTTVGVDGSIQPGCMKRDPRPTPGTANATGYYGCLTLPSNDPITNPFRGGVYSGP